ncbi:MAG: peptide-methionine (S)-S-oxide reductase MsrA [Hyphomonadaceae bacterium]
MRRASFIRTVLAAAAIGLGASTLMGALTGAPASAEEAARVVPAAALGDIARTGTQTAVLSGGCFWGMEGVYEHVRGVLRVRSGYAGGAAAAAHYRLVTTGTTGHAESIEIQFDPRVISYQQILRIFFSVAHDPTQLNRQGPDHGTQYRSAIWAADADQARVAQAYIAQLNAAHAFSRPIVTRVEPLRAFYPAEAYHQDYLALNPTQPYIVINDLPKIDNLRRLFPTFYRTRGRS